ncbi:helicase-associated domain-containing protein [Paenibacillus sp. TRM 82003]|nr:helicase-associated domain-containing protein [Paenibacillus sp. TRM 82003]
MNESMETTSSGVSATALSEAERKTLRTIVLRYAEEPFTAEAIEAAAPGRVTGFEAELGIERLRARGIVETRRKSWGETVHAMAPGLFPHWQREFVPEIGRLGAVAADGADCGYEPIEERKTGFAKRLLALLATASTSGGLTLTQKGALHKKDAARLAARLDVDEEALAGLDIAYLHQDKLAKSLAIVYDAALRLGLLRQGVARAELEEGRLSRWLASPNARIDRDLLAFWWDVYTPADVWLQHGAAAIRSAPDGSWIDLDEIAEALLQAGVPTGGRTEEEARDALASYWAEPMAAFGWLVPGKRTEEAQEWTAYRKEPIETSDGSTEEDAGWYVQPDLEIIVPPSVPYSARWTLEACSDFVQGDTVDRYQITKESWERAIAGGRDGKALLEALRRNALYGVPEPVESLLVRWSETYGAVTLEEVMLLRCKRAEDAAFLAADEGAAPFLLEHVGDLDFIVARQHVKLLTERLKQQGFSPREGRGAAAPSNASTTDEGGSGGDVEREPSGIVYSRRSVSLYPIDPSPGGADRLRARLDRVPQAWLRSYRRYHASTVRELMETAIDVRTSVRLMVEGREVELVPKRVQPLGAEWIVEGYVNGERTSVSSGACGEAQLLLPEQA